jgi:hypothetical protein
MESVIRLLCVLVACCRWLSMEIMDPDPKRGYLSVARMAELAQLPFFLVPPRENEEPWRRRFQMSCVERALRILRDALFVPYTEQYREEKLDGRRRCTGPAKRKLSVGLFKKINLYPVLMERRRYLEEKRQQLEDAQFKAGIGTDLAMTSVLHKTETTVKPPVPVQQASGDRTNVPRELSDEVYAEHPKWSFADIMNEARRRMRAPPGGSSGEPSDEG